MKKRIKCAKEIKTFYHKRLKFKRIADEEEEVKEADKQKSSK